MGGKPNSGSLRPWNGSRRELRRLDTTHQAEFAFLDALRACDSPLPARTSGRNPRQAMAKAKERHQKLLKMAAANIQGDGTSGFGWS